MADNSETEPQHRSEGGETPQQRDSNLLLDTLRRRDSVVIGRGTECDVVIKDPKASRRHCQLTRKEGSFLLEDLGSRNGTYVNGQRITEPVLLKPNETFKIGETMFYLT